MGGGAIRNVAKAAAIGGYRSAVGRGMPRQPPSASVPNGSAESAPAMSVTSFDKAPVVPGAVQRPAWEIEEWEFAAWKVDDEVLDSFDVAPRLVFGPVPTLEEAKEATADLKDAIEKEYFSPTTTDSTLSSTTTDSTLSSEGWTNGENLSFVRSMPNHVVQAFSLLQGSPEAQDVVASLASDKNVWDAVMKNEKVMAFYKSQESVVLPPETNLDSKEFSEGDEQVSEPLGISETDDEKTTGGSVFMDVVNMVKQKVQAMINNISGFLGDFMGTMGGHSSTSMKDTTGSSESDVNVAIGASFIGLAIAAILVVLLKRG